MLARFRFFLVFALVVRSLLPAGFMLAPAASADSDGGFTVTICTGDGLRSLAVDREGKPLQPAKSTSDHSVCPYVLGAMVLGDAAPTAAHALRFEYLDYRIDPARFDFRRPPATKPARGPPQLLS